MVDFMKRRIPDEFADRFVFEGLRPRDEVLKRYAAATACVFAAPWDNLPYTCCEAMAYGGCVIAADNGRRVPAGIAEGAFLRLPGMGQ